jgi:hypothetical protein
VVSVVLVAVPFIISLPITSTTKWLLNQATGAYSAQVAPNPGNLHAISHAMTEADVLGHAWLARASSLGDLSGLMSTWGWVHNRGRDTFRVYNTSCT